MKSREDNYYICDNCMGEIYDSDIICDLNDIFGEGRHIVHEECVVECVCGKKDKFADYIFDDLCRVSEVADIMVEKRVAWEYFDDMEGDCDGFMQK